MGDGFGEEVARRVHAVAGDVSRDGLGLDDEGRRALAAADVVIHSAATVSFDAPLTQAVEINLLGPSRVAAAIAETGSAAHLVAVSTAYVASTHQGEAKEELLSENRFTLDVPWEAEVTLGPTVARRPGGRVPQTRADCAPSPSRPRAEIGAAGDHLIASKAEKLREEWVSGELVTAGTARALSLGWPDAYPFTKALGERALVEQWEGRVPITRRPALDHRVRAGRAPARLDPRLPHGGAHHRVLCPRACSASSRACPRASST